MKGLETDKPYLFAHMETLGVGDRRGTGIVKGMNDMNHSHDGDGADMDLPKRLWVSP